MQKGYTVKICEKTFEDEISKQAYLKACKWLAVNVYGSESYSDCVTVKIKKCSHKKSDKTYKFNVELYFIADFEHEQKVFCNNCKLMQNTFFGSNITPCQTCRLTPLLKNLERVTENTAESLRRSFEDESD